MWSPLGRGKTYFKAAALNYDDTFMENRQCWYHKNVMGTINSEDHTANRKPKFLQNLKNSSQRICLGQD